MVSKWDQRFLDLARYVSLWSKDPSTKTGAVITKGRQVVSLGYNGFAAGVADTPERLEDRKTKYAMMVHCERNAMLYARELLRGCTLYTWPFMSCAPCAAMVIQVGIVRCVAPASDNPRWQEDFALASLMFAEAGVELVLVGGGE
jgi:dCMP deaminase